MSSTVFRTPDNQTGDVDVPGKLVAIQDQNGGWTGRQTFTIQREDIDSPAVRNKFVFGARATDLDPKLESYWSRLALRKTDVRHRDGGLVEIDVSYAGYVELGQPVTTTPRYFGKGFEYERSIMQHPKVVSLSDTDREIIEAIIRGDCFWDFAAAPGTEVRLRPDGVAVYKNQPSAGNATIFAQEASKGQTSYFVQGMVWRKTWDDETGIDPSDIANLGKIDTPDGSPPDPPGSGSWRLTDWSQEQTGVLFRNSLEWTAQSQEDWNTEIYG